MIVVNLKHSMRRLLEQVQLGSSDDDLLRELQRVSSTAWSGLSKQALDRYGSEWNDYTDDARPRQQDYLLGIRGEQVVSAYYITGYQRDDQNRVVFDLEPAVELAGAIGQPTPGGPWKQGEARPVRYFETAPFMRDLEERGVLDAYDDAGDDAVDRRMVAAIRGLASPAAQSPLAGVEVEPDSRGGVRLTVPMGTKVTVVQRKDR